MKVFSPSYKRAKIVKTHKIIPNVIYCVHEFEVKEYEEEGYNVQALPDSIRGNIARVRNHIKTNLIGDKGIIIDDDIEAIKRWDIKEKPESKDVEDIEEFIEMGFMMCEEAGCTLWGVNILGDKGSYKEYTPFGFKSTVSGSFMGFVNCDVSFDEDLPLKEDYDFCIQVLNKYRKLLRFNMVSLVNKDHKNVGGCADYRTLKREEEQMEMFIQKWGSDIVKVDRSKRKSARENVFDINPIIRVPIGGV